MGRGINGEGKKGGGFEEKLRKGKPLSDAVLGSSLLKKDEKFRGNRRVVSFREP
jgi:hypothetical protein